MENSSRRDRLMGKLFGKDKKPAGDSLESQASLDAFLRSSSDNLNITHVPPPPPPSSTVIPKLSKLDTTVAKLPAAAVGVNQQAQRNRPVAQGRPVDHSVSQRRGPRPNKKGLSVRFTDAYPDVIGEGGDETDLPTVEISKRKKAKPPSPVAQRAPPPFPQQSPPKQQQPTRLPPPPAAATAPPPASNPFADVGKQTSDDPDFVPKPLLRTATGFSSVYTPDSDDDDDEQEPSPVTPVITNSSNNNSPFRQRASLQQLAAPTTPEHQPANTLRPGKAFDARYLDSGRHDEDRRSFIEIHQAEMREAEGLALAKAARGADTTASGNWADSDRPPSASIDSSPEQQRRQQNVSPVSELGSPIVQYSPAASIRSDVSSEYNGSREETRAPPAPPPPQHQQLHENAHRAAQQQAQAQQQQQRQKQQQQQQQQPLPPHMHSREPSTASQKDTPSPQPSTSSVPASVPAPGLASLKLHDVVAAVSDDAFNAFVTRTSHLFELFRLHSEASGPLSSRTPRDCARAGLWWFIKGRMGLEKTIRERPSSPQSQMHHEIDRQQAYTNLAKGYWLCKKVIPEVSQLQGIAAADAEVNEVTHTLVSALSKMAMSMKRNGILPPEEAFLPQTIDKSIWVEYPALSQDVVALLSGNWGSSLSAMQHQLSTLHLLDAFPLGDAADTFSLGRFVADVYLMEQGSESHRLHIPAILSAVRPKKHTGLVFVLASQNGSLQLAIQETKSAGPKWDDVRWRSDTCSMDVRLPRGFMLAVQLTQADFRSLWTMYDFAVKIKSTLYPRQDEMVVFRNTLRSFQYIESETAQSRVFPKDPVPHCEVGLFERIHKESRPTGTRSWHRGFRIAVTTGASTKTLSGVHHTYPPSMPIQFGFFRTEGDAPALSLRFESGRQRGRMVLTFTEEKERIRFHSLLTGTALDHDERIFADVPLRGFVFAESIREPLGLAPFSRMPWKAARVVNDEFGPSGEQPPTVQADHLKVVLEYQNGTITDRVNVGPGELRMRLEVTNAKLFRIMRQPQSDMTMSVSEAQVPKELPRNLTEALRVSRSKQTIRSLEFTTLRDLHAFQAALTGWEVVFDGLAPALAITRRHMIVPIHKKWEAGYTRIQLVKQDDMIQLLAFFEEFQHGHCLNFILKGTDVYEGFARGGKTGTARG
ncbi:hypothetical protein GMORB2_6229 [Geosmithia morbida]|uniref:Uncharacterized protein n=1 Tax=Geosmithia morbida TaxID=1094350 RepID=A0A9P5D164_9HYPO|nr:uncharacterized protein GMORB2_6229 [Geosmithia morbida]KAF4123528.1 hypothetical protein GMORB2_6229 [Geosmithia morbida]